MKKKFGDMNELMTESVIENVTDLAEVMVEVNKMRMVKERMEKWKKRRNEYQNEYNKKVRGGKRKATSRRREAVLD